MLSFFSWCVCDPTWVTQLSWCSLTTGRTVITSVQSHVFAQGSHNRISVSTRWTTPYCSIGAGNWLFELDKSSSPEIVDCYLFSSSFSGDNWAFWTVGEPGENACSFWFLCQWRCTNEWWELPLPNTYCPIQLPKDNKTVHSVGIFFPSQPLLSPVKSHPSHSTAFCMYVCLSAFCTWDLKSKSLFYQNKQFICLNEIIAADSVPLCLGNDARRFLFILLFNGEAERQGPIHCSIKRKEFLGSPRVGRLNKHRNW